MTISSTSSKALGRGNGVTTAFVYSFLIPSADLVRVTYVNAAGVQTVLDASLYTISGLGLPAGGQVTYPLSGSPIAAGTSLVIERVLPLVQPSSFNNQGGFFPEAVEASLDYVTMLLQQIAQGSRDFPNALLFPSVDVAPVTTLPPANTRANKFFAFDASGNPTMLPATGAPADLSAYLATSTGASSSRSFASRFSDVLSVKDFGATGDGVTNDTVALAAARTAMIARGGGILFAPAGTYNHDAIFDVPTGTLVRGAGRKVTKLKWVGANGSAQVRFVQGTTQAGVDDVTVDTGTATSMTGIHMRDTQRNNLSRVAIVSTVKTSGEGIRLQAGFGGAGSTFNTAFNTFRDVEITKFLNAVQMDGIASGPTVVTNNVFDFLHCDTPAAGVRLAQWCDSNSFYRAHVNLDINNAIGVICNDSATPAADVGVYNNNFYDLSVDAFGAIAGCSAIFMNATKQFNVIGFYHSPQVWPGTLINDNLLRAISFYIVNNQISSANNFIQIWTKGMYRPSVLKRSAAGTVYGLGPTDLTWPVTSFDTTGATSATTFTAQNSARYSVSLNLLHTAGVTPADQWLIKCITTPRTYAWVYYVNAAQLNSVVYSLDVDLKVGETMKFTIERFAGAGNFPLHTDTDLNFWTIEQVSP